MGAVIKATLRVVGKGYSFLCGIQTHASSLARKSDAIDRKTSIAPLQPPSRGVPQGGEQGSKPRQPSRVGLHGVQVKSSDQ